VSSGFVVEVDSGVVVVVSSVVVVSYGFEVEGAVVVVVTGAGGAQNWTLEMSGTLSLPTTVTLPAALSSATLVAPPVSFTASATDAGL
jgi:hypothetical protein